MECLLMCSNRTHDPIYLPDQNPVIVGRSIETKIREKKLSRKQGTVVADEQTQESKIKNPRYLLALMSDLNELMFSARKGVIKEQLIALTQYASTRRHSF